MPSAKPTPLWVIIANRACRNWLGVDLEAWPACDRNRVLCAALDAEREGWVAIRNAAVDAAKAIMRRRKGSSRR